MAWPIIGLNVLSVLTLAVDTAMCGRLEDSETALKALGFATQVVFLLMVAMMGLTVGTVALVSRAYGSGDSKRVNHVMMQSTMLTVLVGIAVGIVGNLFAPGILRTLGASEPVVEAGLLYLRPLLTFTTFYYLMILYGGVLRGVGNTRLPFLIALAANILNVFLNYGLILGNWGLPALGLRGAAIGTVLSYLFSVVVMITVLRRGGVPNLTLPLRPKRLDRPLALELYRIGAPAALDMVILNAAFLSIVGMLGRIDEISVAAHGIGLRMQALAFVPGLGVSQATAAMVGQALGAGNIERAKSIARSSVVMSTILMSALAAAIVFFAFPIVAIFDVAPGSALEDYSVTWMRVLGYGMPPVGIHIAIVGLLQGAGATNTSLRINIVGTLLFQIPLSILFGFALGWGALGVWISFPVSFVIKAVLGYGAYKTERWAKTGLRVEPS